MFEKVVEEIEKEAIKWVKDVFPNDEFKQSGISRALVEFAELGYNKANEQLTKAKEIIKKFSEFVNNEVEFDTEHPQEHTDLWNELCEKAEQFLSEVEK